MHSININLTSLAVILWSGMLIIAGSIWVLSSQVRKLADLLEERGPSPAPAGGGVVEVRLEATAAQAPARVGRRGAPVRVRGAVRGPVAGPRGQAQLLAPGRTTLASTRSASAERPDS